MHETAFQRVMNHLAKAAWLAVALACFGCATPVATKHQASSGSVAVVALSHEPELKLEGIGRGEIAANGIGCLSYLFELINPPAALAKLAICGAVIGVMAAIPPDEEGLKSSEDHVRAGMVAPAIQEAMRGHVEASMRAGGVDVGRLSFEHDRAAQSRDYRQLHAQGIDRVLETAVVQIGTRGLGQNTPLAMLTDPPLFPYLRARVRLIRTADNAEILAREFEYRGTRRKQSGWVGSGRDILSEFQVGYRALAEHISDSVFRMYVLRDQNSRMSRTMAGWGLEQHDRRTIVESMDSVHPTLRWEGFPRAQDLEWEAAEMARVKGVTYDVIVARAELGAPGEIVYRREGITDAAHRIETALAPRTGYYWTVRARFQLDGRERVTEWACFDRPTTEPDLAPPAYGYMFRTKTGL